MLRRQPSSCLSGSPSWFEELPVPLAAPHKGAKGRGEEPNRKKGLRPDPCGLRHHLSFGWSLLGDLRALSKVMKRLK